MAKIDFKEVVKKATDEFLDKNMVDKRKIRKAKKIDREKVEQLAGQGLCASDIAKHQDVVPSTITRYLDKIDKKNEQLKRYKDNQLQVVYHRQLKKDYVADIIVDSWIEEGGESIKAKSDSTKKEILHTLQGGTRYDFEQQRLLEDKSTTNVSYPAMEAGFKDLERQRQVEITKLGYDPADVVEGEVIEDDLPQDVVVDPDLDVIESDNNG